VAQLPAKAAPHLLNDKTMVLKALEGAHGGLLADVERLGKLEQ
jgi:hypothetical protein